MTQRFNQQLMTKADAAQIFGVCPKTIENYIKDGLIPKPVPFASKEYWHPAEFAAFIDRTFRRVDETAKESQVASATEDARPKCNSPLTAGEPQRPRDTKDSHSVVRAKARQRATLQRLNAGQ